MTNIETNNTSQEDFEAFQQEQAEKNIQKRENQAEFHNKFGRSLGEKVLRRGKNTELVIAQTEAGIMDKQIDDMIKKGETKDRTEAITKLSLVDLMHSDTEAYKEYTNLLIQSEKMTQNEIFEYILPLAKKRLSSGMEHSTRVFTLYRDDMAEAGIMTVEEAAQLPEVRDIAKKRLSSGMEHSTRVFTLYRDDIVEAGIMTIKEANLLVMKTAILRLESAKAVSEQSYQYAKEALLEAGIDL